MHNRLVMTSMLSSYQEVSSGSSRQTNNQTMPLQQQQAQAHRYWPESDQERHMQRISTYAGAEFTADMEAASRTEYQEFNEGYPVDIETWPPTNNQSYWLLLYHRSDLATFKPKPLWEWFQDQRFTIDPRCYTLQPIHFVCLQSKTMKNPSLIRLLCKQHATWGHCDGKKHKDNLHPASYAHKLFDGIRHYQREGITHPPNIQAQGYCENCYDDGMTLQEYADRTGTEYFPLDLEQDPKLIHDPSPVWLRTG